MLASLAVLDSVEVSLLALLEVLDSVEDSVLDSLEAFEDSFFELSESGITLDGVYLLYAASLNS